MKESFMLVCPYCKNQEEIHLSDFQHSFGGLRRLAIVHKDHTLIVDIDSSFSIRAAYITSFANVIGQPLVFKHFRVLTDVIFTKYFEFITLWPDSKLIDIRACPSCIPHLYDVLNMAVDSLQYRSGSFANVLSASDKMSFVVIRKPHLVLLGLIDSKFDESKKLWFNAIADTYATSPPKTEVLVRIIEYLAPKITHMPTESHIYKLRTILAGGML
ncbi:MAG: hypothetical protein QXY55_01870 [Candidatus Korarchaeota archaeon]|nr:hypothetical protein [Thermoproteota archaeon]